jgi:hypothetical protein
MALRPRFSTSTVTVDTCFVPWLAASGPLSYTPESPPSSDYYFQYSWILPGIFSDAANRRQHFYFGECSKERAERLFSFWKAAKDKAVTRVALVLGRDLGDTLDAPLAAYAYRTRGGQSVRVLMQHGSYQLLDVDEQPLLDSGEAVLYRGIGKAETFRFLRVGSRDADSEQGRVWRQYLSTQARVLSDSTLSFNSIHDRAKRAETSHIRDGTWLTDDIAKENGLDIETHALAKELWLTTHQSFTLARNIAEWKFGPHFVKCRTPLTNIRLTTFFANEHEVRIIDPDRVEFLECVGCELREVSTG